ncbi:hypothetical protein IFR05_003650 [Cadophora sp. M221]|nr:hypothetical protein IFR05_003650 [Cadophora sp. M221]
MVNSSRSHIYPALDKSSSKIRLIHLQPRSRGDKITCRLCIADLNDDDLKYEALSYEWGEKDTSRIILVNGEEFPVRENLWWALTYLREDNAERVFWIDALCIDQSDERERNHQVSLMTQVYSRASRVVAWLGKDGQDDLMQVAKFIDILEEESELNDLVKDDEARGFLPHFLPSVGPRSTTAASFWSVPVNMLNGSAPRRLNEDDHRRGWEAWDNICHRSYWSRLWILQELILAGILVLRCGNVELDRESTHRIFDRTRTQRPPSSEPKPDRLAQDGLDYSSHSVIPLRIHQRRTRMFLNPDRPGNTFTTLVGQFLIYRKAQCADVRDRIFGLLGISPQCCRDNIPVDYGISTIDLALSVIAHDEFEHQSFRSGSFSSKLRADSYIKYLGCTNDAHRVIAAIEATDGPLWPPFGSPEEEQELWRRHDSSVVTFIQAGQLVLQFPERYTDQQNESMEIGMAGKEIVRDNMFVRHRSRSGFH